jgi:hypothetical protein
VEEDAPGWRPLEPAKRPSEPAVPVTPFSRLARTHAFMISGDTLVALALAGSLFFSVSPTAARGQVALYLVLTMAPFAVVAPLIGPAMDRMAGGRRLMVLASALIRCVVCLLMARHIDSLLLFPEAFTVLVMGKGYSVAKSALVPGTISSDAALVEANSKLSMISTVTGFVVAGPGVLILNVLGPSWLLGVAALLFANAARLGVQIPRRVVAEAPPDPVERAELRGAGILLAASAMGVLRMVVGFLAFLVAFSLRSTGAPAYWFGIVLGASGVGSFIGVVVAPHLRKVVAEERILQGVLAGLALLALVMVQVGGRTAAAILALGVGFAASAGKLSFDAIVQRDAPDANRGRSFARFETRFQLLWVLGAFIPVVIPIPLRIGFLVIAGLTGFALVSYVTGLGAVHRHHPPGGGSASGSDRGEH